jgi:PTH1 family peptidyl-tRNA hydrolase
MLLVVVDDVALPLAMIRVRPQGSAGGHNGLKSIIASLGAQFIRVRLGVKPDHPVSDMSDFVLSPVPKRQREEVARMVERAADAVEVILHDGVERAMATFNQRIAGAGPETNDHPCSGQKEGQG